MANRTTNHYRESRLLPLLLAGAFFLFGCSGDSESEAAESPTPEEADLATAPAGPSDEPTGTLIVDRGDVRYLPAGGDELAVEAGSHHPFGVSDRAQAGNGGLGLVQFPAIDLEIFFFGDVVLDRIATSPEGLTKVDLTLEAGHLRLALDESSPVTVEVQAGDRTLTTREPGTEATICQGGNGTTCLEVAKGLVEWFGQGERIDVADSKSTFAHPGQPPELPLHCSNRDEFDAWLEQARRGEAEIDLAGLVDTWAGSDDCATDIGAIAGSRIPPDAGMSHVEIVEPAIGTSDFEQDAVHYREPMTLGEAADFWVNDELVSNDEFRSWLVNVAKDDPDEWRRLAPDSWIQNAPGGAATQATYPDGEDQSPVVGAGYEAAELYCQFEDKYLIKEVQWELAAANGYFEWGTTQEWVADHDSYGPGIPDDQRVLRGTDDTVQPDLYYRLAVIDDIERPIGRQFATIRCAADETRALSGLSDVNAVYSDDFVDFANEWPRPQGTDGFDIGYHAPSYYHVESSDEHRQVLVVDDLEPTGAALVKSNAFIRNASEDPGNFRYGVAVGTREQGEFVTFTVQPEQVGDDLTLHWCLEHLASDDPLVTSLTESGDGYGSYLLPEGSPRHRAEAPCESGLASGRIDVDQFENTLAMTVDGSDVSLSIDEQRLEITAGELELDQALQLDSAGFFVETFHKDLVHIHFDTIEVSSR